MKYKLEIACDNGAFDGNPACEVARILRELADRMLYIEPFEDHPIRDLNGNRVGHHGFTGVKS